MANRGCGVATSGANSNPDVRIDVISSEPLLPNTELSEALDSFRANGHGMSDFYTAMGGRLLKGHQSLKETSEAAACILFLDEEKTELARVREQQSQMQKKLQSADNVIKAKLDRANVLKYACVVLYVIVTVIGVAAMALAAASSAYKKTTMAMAAAAAYLFGGLGKLIDSLLNKHASAVEKEREISKAMIAAGKFIIKDLNDNYELVCELKSEIEYLQKMDSDEVAVRNKLAEVKERFQEELQSRAKRCSLDASVAIKYALNSIMRNMDSGE